MLSQSTCVVLKAPFCFQNTWVLDSKWSMIKYLFAILKVYTIHFRSHNKIKNYMEKVCGKGNKHGIAAYVIFKVWCVALSTSWRKMFCSVLFSSFFFLFLFLFFIFVCLFVFCFLFVSVSNLFRFCFILFFWNVLRYSFCFVLFWKFCGIKMFLVATLVNYTAIFFKNLVNHKKGYI